MTPSENQPTLEAGNDQAAKATLAIRAKWKSKARLAAQLEQFSGDAETFEERMRQVAQELGGDYLFGLPASGLLDNCQRIAAIRLPLEGSEVTETAFILLDAAGENVRLSNHKDRLKDLEKFSAAFVDVLGRIGPLPEVSASEA